MPSYYEGAPVATVEAMSTGKPFVGADSQGINGFIRHGENGLLVPSKDSHELAMAILKLGENARLGKRLATQARKDIAWLVWDKQLPVLLKLYSEILAPN